MLLFCWPPRSTAVVLRRLLFPTIIELRNELLSLPTSKVTLEECFREAEGFSVCKWLVEVDGIKGEVVFDEGFKG